MATTVLILDMNKYLEILAIYCQSLDFKKRDFTLLDFFLRDPKIITRCLSALQELNFFILLVSAQDGN
jgi:hypothetical protein